MNEAVVIADEGRTPAVRAVMAETDWTASPLGPPEAWPASLRTIMQLILPAQAQIVLFWGPDYVALYNDAYAPTIGDKHPHAFGRPAREYWTELWDDLEPLLRSVRDTGETVSARDRPFYIERHGYGETVYFDISYSAAPDDAGAVGGVLCIVSETTERVLLEQEQQFFLALSDAIRPLADPVQVVATTSRMLGERLGAARVAYAEVDEDAGVATIHGDWTDGRVGHMPDRLQLADFGAPLLDWLRSGRTLVVNHIAEHPVTEGHQQGPEAIAARAVVSVPLVKDGRLVANLNVHEPHRRAWTPAQVRLVEQVAERTWEAVRRARVEAAQQAARRELQLLADTLPVLISYMDADRRYRFVNSAYERWFPSRRREEILGLPVHEVIGEAAYEGVRPWMDRVLAGEAVSFEQFMPYAEGGHRHIHVEYVPRLEGGRVAGFYALITDVTEARRAEAQLRQSEARLQAVVDQASAGIAQVDLQGRFTDVNDRYCEMTGRSRAELLQLAMQDITHPDDLPVNLPLFEAAAARGEPFEVEKRYLRPDGSHIWVNNSVYAVHGPDGRPESIVAVSMDLTDRRAAETALRESEARFRNMADHAPVMMWVTDEGGACTYLNRAWYEFTGQTPEQAEGFGWLEATHPDDKPAAERVFMEANAERAPFRLEYRLRRADGAYRWAIDAASPRFGPDGAFLGYIGSVIDIDERHEAEQAIETSEERLRLATDAADLGFWDVDVVNDVLIWPPRVKAMFGISGDRPVSMTDFYEGLHPDDAPATAEAFAAACDPDRRALYDVEYRTIGKEDGIVRWVAAKGRGIFDPAGRCVRVVGTAIDVTARKQVEIALRDSLERLRFLGDLDEALRDAADPMAAMAAATRLLARRLDVTRAAFADVDDDNDRFLIRADYSAPGVASSVGEYSLDLFGPRAAADMRTGRTLVVRDVPAELAPGQGREMFQSIGIDAIICCPLVRDGRLRAMMAVHNAAARDWTADEVALVEAVVERCWAHVERVGAQARLSESEAKFHAIANSIDQMVWSTRADGYHDYFNDRWYDFTGVPYGSTDGDGWNGIFHPEDQDRAWATWRHSLETGEPYHIEYRLRHRSGQYRWVIGRAQCARDEAGRIVRWYGTCTDIHDLKEAESRLRESEERYRTLFESIESGFCVVEVALDNPRTDYRVVEANPAFYRQTGFPEDIIGRWLRDAAPDLEEHWFEIYGRVARTGRSERFEQGSALLGRWFDVYAFRVGEPDERRVAILFTDISARRNAEERLREESRTLETLNTTGAALAAELDLERVVQMVTDAGVALTGAQFGAFFYNVLDDAGESYMLYTLSGVDRSRFEGFPMPRATAIFRPTFNGEGVVRSDDILADPRYGKSEPHFGMPKGHLPVRSYLAVPVTSRSGEVIGGLFFGHPEPGRFDDRHERLMIGLAGQSSIAMDNARLYQDVRRANETLEQRVLERTVELETAHEALRQSQKMEAMGQLTGGVAHDFNNLLTPIVGALDLLQRKGVGGPREQRLIGGAAHSADRAKTLVQRLLAFARRQPLQMVPVDIAQLVAGMADLIGSTTGPQIKVVVNVEGELPPAKADPNQLEMALLNLAVNARDAMPDGGALRISASAETIAADAVPGLAAGDYVRLSVADTGTGMNEDTLKRAIEPFFSTKGIGRGTGLGLSMVHGLASQLGGALTITSKLGLGTNIELWLPQSREAPADREGPRDAPAAPRRGTVLLVDDEDYVRLSTADMLEDLGYRVIEAASSEEALALVAGGAEFDLLVTDHLMPGMTGSELARRLLQQRAGLPVLVISGYAESEGVAPDLPRLTKPFRAEELAESLAAVMAD